MFYYMQIKDSDYRETESIKKENKKKKELRNYRVYHHDSARNLWVSRSDVI